MPEDAALGARLRRCWRALLSELVATALLMALGLAALLPLPGKATALAHPAMAFGCVVAGNAVAFGPVSGAHMNPAVTLAALLAGRLGPLRAAGYALAQALGALLGFGALLALLPVASPQGCTAPAAGVGPAAAAALEAVMTAALALACCALWAAHDELRPDHAAPVKLGLLVAGLIYAGGNATGASLNPVRSLAPALLHGHWDHQWVYWVGPLSGAALAALLHRVLLAPALGPRLGPALGPRLGPALGPRLREASDGPTPETLPLHDKP